VDGGIGERAFLAAVLVPTTFALGYLVFRWLLDPLMALFGWTTRPWVFWVLGGLGFLGACASLSIDEARPFAEFEPILVIGAAWAAARDGSERSRSLGELGRRESRGLALVFAALSLSGLASAVLVVGGGLAAPLLTVPIVAAYGLSAGCIALGLVSRRTWTPVMFMVWGGIVLTLSGWVIWLSQLDAARAGLLLALVAGLLVFLHRRVRAAVGPLPS
jgi:hypothetical protein